MNALTGFLGTLFWALLALAQFVAGLLMRVFMVVLWLCWPLLIMGFLIATAQSAEAGWFSWLWGSDTEQLEHSLEVAQEAARVASQAAEAQARHAAAQADQNSKLAETLGQLSSERSNLADHLHALMEFGLKDSQWAAAINASGPLLVCITAIIVAGLALWLVGRPGESQQSAKLAETVDLLMEEIAVYRSADDRQNYGSRRLLGPRAANHTTALARFAIPVGHDPEEPTWEDELPPDDADPDESQPASDSGPLPF
ncbi:MAG: hypothetical protein K8S94_09150 [Planctomycetia bacterium]|nr:hypothetical protein [Planctomycetia bacterium]